MKPLRNSLLIFILITTVSAVGVAQDYTLRDQSEIEYRAQLTLFMLKDLLNIVSNNQITDAEIKELIQISYQDTVTPIFYSHESIIEDDIRPSNLKDSHEQDKTVKDYLTDFDLTYEKSDQYTVEFSDFKASNLKYGEYLYMKMKFTSHFKGRHKEDPTPYQPVDRIAEFRVENMNNQWRALITSIIYYDPANNINSTEGDVEVDTTVYDDSTFRYLIDQSKSGGNSVAQIMQAKEEARFASEQDSLFRHYMEIGQLAFEEERFDDAIAAYSEAQTINPFNTSVRQQIREVNRAENRKSLDEDKKYEEAKVIAERAQSARNYTKAKNFYAEALRLRPNETSIRERIEKLDRIIQKLAFFESKFNVGQYKEAIKDYNKAIKDNRGNADYYFGRGKCYEMVNDIKDAIKDYTAAIEIDGNFVEALNKRAKLYVLTDQPHKAIADYSLIISNPDYAADYYPELAKIRKFTGDNKGAIQDYNSAITLRPDVAEYYYERGLLFYLEKQLDEAIHSYSQTIEKDDGYVNAYYQRGLTFIDLDKTYEASVDFAKAKNLGLKEDQQSVIKKIALNYFIAGEGAMKLGNFENALENYINTILISPTYGNAWLRKGDAYYSLQDYDNAITNYHKAIEFDSISYACFRRGLAYQQIGDEEAALQDFKSYVPIGKAVVARVEGNIKQGGHSLHQTYLLREENAESLYYLGYAQLKTEQYSDALGNLEKAIGVKKNYPQAFFAKGSSQYALKEYKKAIKDFEKGIKLGYTEPDAYYSLGLAYEAKGKMKDAISNYSQAIKLDDKFLNAYHHRAICYKNKEQYEQALQDIKTIFSLNESANTDVQLITHRGLLELYQKNLLEAKQSFDLALSLEGNAPWALYGKACALASENKIEESLQLYQKAFQPNEIEWSAIKKDPLIKPIRKEKAFKTLVKASF